MKHLFTIIFLTVLFGTSSADHRQSSSVLNLQLYGRGDFDVKIDGVNYRWVDNGLQIGALAPGNHFIQVTQHFRNQGHQGQHGRQGRSGYAQRTIYNGQLQIPMSSIVWARFTPNYGVRIDRIDPIIVDRRPVPRDQCRNLNGNCQDHNHRNDGRQGGGSDWYDDNDRDHRDGQRGQNHKDDRGSGNRGYNDNTQSDFMALQGTIRQATFDSDKLMIANQFVRFNTISAQEVAAIMRLMTYESNKLEFAKNAYAACYDKQNYFLVNQAFTYSSSIRQLNAFIK